MLLILHLRKNMDHKIYFRKVSFTTKIVRDSYVNKKSKSYSYLDETKRLNSIIWYLHWSFAIFQFEISHSWLEAALKYKPYIRTEFAEKTSLKTKQWSLEMG